MAKADEKKFGDWFRLALKEESTSAKAIHCLEQAEKCLTAPKRKRSDYDFSDWLHLATIWKEKHDRDDESSRCLIEAEKLTQDSPDQWMHCARQWKKNLGNHDRSIACMAKAENSARTQSANQTVQAYIRVAAHWKKEFRDKAAGVRCMKKAEEVCGGYPNDWTNCAIAWIEHFSDPIRAHHCMQRDEETQSKTLEGHLYRTHLWHFWFKDNEATAKEMRKAEGAAASSGDWLECARKWTHLKKNEETRRCLLTAEDKCQTAGQYKACLEAWEDLLKDAESATRCKAKMGAAKKNAKKDLPFDLKLDQVWSNLKPYLKDRVKKCSHGDYMDLGEPKDPVKLIVFGYNFNQSGWVKVVFDSRPEAESDGMWTDTGEDAVLVPEWEGAIQAYFHQNLTDTQVILSNQGKAKTMKFGGNATITALGKILKDHFFRFCQEGGLKGMNLAPDCVVATEDFEGVYGNMTKLSKIMKAGG